MNGSVGSVIIMKGSAQIHRSCHQLKVDTTEHRRAVMCFRRVLNRKVEEIAIILSKAALLLIVKVFRHFSDEYNFAAVGRFRERKLLPFTHFC
jgi:hypothetical protein